MKRTATLYLLFTVLTFVCSATESDTLTVLNLANHVRIMGMENDLPIVSFNHPDVGRYHDTSLPFSAIVQRIPVSHSVGMHATASYEDWRPITQLPTSIEIQPTTELRVVGRKAWQPIAQVMLWPWRASNGVLEVANRVTIVTHWDGSIEDAPSRVVTQQHAWYEPNAPYVRIHSSRDGIGVIAARTVIDIEPRFRGVPVDSLALFWKGAEQPLYVIGKDSADSFESSDTVLFMARHAQGDTSFLSMEDSTAIFFLTTRSEGERRRFTMVTSSSSVTDLPAVTIHERVELDTGYYHLGSSLDEEFGDYYTDLGYLEGFYWESLNTNAYERSRWKYTITPAQSGSVSVTTHYVASSNTPQFNPDTRLDVAVNGALPVPRETDGFGAFTITNTADVSRTPSGLQKLQWYATGIDSLRGRKEYFSEILIDAVEIIADVLPVMDSGRARVHIPLRPSATNISWYNAEAGGWWLDTTSSTIGRLTAHRPASIVRAGLAPHNRNWPTVADNPQYWWGSATFGGATVEVDTVNGFAVFVQSSPTSAPVVRNGLTDAAAAQVIDQAPFHALIAVICATPQTSTALESALQRRMLPAPVGTRWVIAGMTDIGGTGSGTTNIEACGTTYIRDANDGFGQAADSHVPAGPAAVLYVASTGGMEQARILPAKLSNLTSDSSQADLVIITHSTHRQQAERLAEHRRLHNHLSVAVVDVDAILDEFGAGSHSANAVRDYLAWRYANAREPRMQTVLLFGNASWDVRLAVKGGNVSAERADQVPTYGRPSSDYFFSLLDDVSDVAVPEVVVGRIPALTQIEGQTMVDKIIFNDTVRFQPWMRTWYFVAGGTAVEGMCDIYRDLLEDTFGTGVTFTTPPLCVDTATLCKSTAPPNAGFYIQQQINNGTQWMNYLGHGATELFDINGWEPSDLLNAGKYGVLATYACQTGAYSNPSVACKNAQYLTEPNKGMFAALGSTGWQHIWAVNLLHLRIHEAQRNGARSLGEILYKAKVPIVSPGQQVTINTVMQYNLLGDPYSRLFIDTIPRLVIRPENISVLPQDGSVQSTDADSIATVRAWVANAGAGTTKPVKVVMYFKYNNETDSSIVVLDNGICQGAWVSWTIPIKHKAGDHAVTVVVDPAGSVDPVSTDRSATVIFSVLPQSLLPIEPVAFEQLASKQFHVRMLDPLGDMNPASVYMAVCTSQSLDDTSIVIRSGPGDIIRTGSVLDWDVSLVPEQPNGKYVVAAWTADATDTSAVVWVPIEIVINTPARWNAGASAMVPMDSAMVLSTEGKGWTLADRSRSVFLKSCGKQTFNGVLEPPLEMRIGDVTYVKNEFYRGFNLIVVNSMDTTPRAIRRYDTWRDPMPREAGHNGFTHDLFKFLTDSVAPSDMVLFALCNESLTGFFENNNIDSLRQILKHYGSRFADSLAANSSWVMIGSPGLEVGTAPEAWKGAPDSMVTLTQVVQFYEQSGEVTTQLVGPGVAWDSLEVDFDSLGTLCFIEGRLADGSFYVVDTVIAGSSTIDANRIRPGTALLRARWTQHHIPGDHLTPYVRGARFFYQPAHEVHLEANAVAVNNDALRGDTIIATVTVRNVDRRFAVQQVPILAEVIGTAQIPVADAAIPLLAPDQQYQWNVRIPTSTLATNSSVSARIDAQRTLTEFYRYNNGATSPLTISEDTVPPWISIHSGNRVLRDGDYVEAHPSLEVRVMDNSRLPITEESKVMVFVNGVRIKSGTADAYRFVPTDSCSTVSADTSLRAAVQFSFPMEIGQNNVLVRATDGTGNQAEKELSIYLAGDNLAVSAVVAPNPSTGPVQFVTTIRTPESSVPVRLVIVDVQGRVVRTIVSSVRQDDALIRWDGLTDSGASVSPGVYAWKIDIPSSTGEWFGGISGTLQMLR